MWHLFVGLTAAGGQQFRHEYGTQDIRNQEVWTALCCYVYSSLYASTKKPTIDDLPPRWASLKGENILKARTFEAVKMMASQNQNIINVASPSPPPVDGPSGAVVSSTTITTMKTQSISSTLSSHTNQQQQLQQSNNIEPLDKSSSNTLKVLR